MDIKLEPLDQPILDAATSPTEAIRVGIEQGASCPSCSGTGRVNQGIGGG